MGAQSHLDTERNRYLSRIYDSIFTNTTLFSLEVVRNEGFLVYPPVFVILVPSNREHKGNTCLASTRDLMIDFYYDWWWRRLVPGTHEMHDRPSWPGTVDSFGPRGLHASAPPISILSFLIHPTVLYNHCL